MLGIENTYAAFCLDEAIVHFGEALENELDQVAEGAKNAKAAEGRQKLVLERWLKLGPYDPKNRKPGDESQPTTPTRFRTPTATR